MSKPEIVLISRKDAWDKGMSRFYSGKPCRNGHLSERYVSNGCCIACLTYKARPALRAANVHMPPTGYALPGHLFGPYITPDHLSDLHAQVLHDITKLINAAEVRTKRFWKVCPPYFWDETRAKGFTREQWLEAGHDDVSLMKLGIIRYAGGG